jgi:oligosaccharide repeat unit polymerase
MTVYGLLLCGTLAFGLKRGKAWAHPVMLVSLWEFLFIFLDAVFTISTGFYGPGEFDRYILDPNVVSQAVAGWTVLHLAALFSLGIFLSRPTAIKVTSSLQNPILGTGKVERVIASYTLLFAFLISGAAIAAVVAPYHGSIYEVWANRNLIFSDGGGILLVGSQVFRYAVILWLVLRWKHRVRTRNLALSVLILLALLLELAVNSRSGVVFGFLLPLLIAYDRYVKRISVRKLLLIALIIFVLFGVAFRTVARDQFFYANQGLTVWQVFTQNVVELPSFFWGGFEASSLDGTIDVMEKYEHNRLSGQTLLNALSAPIPRPLWSDKPRGGANNIYTETYYPDFYGSIRTEYSVSFTGELYMNFGFLGVEVGGVLLGIWLYALHKLYTNRSMLALIVYGVAVGRTFSLLRGDAFNFVGQLISSLAALTVVVAMIWILRSFLFTFAYRQRVRPVGIRSHNAGLPGPDNNERQRRIRV